MNPTQNQKWQILAEPNMGFGELQIIYKNNFLTLLAGTGTKAKLNAFRLKKLIHKTVAFLKTQKAQLIGNNFKDYSKLTDDEISLLLGEANYEFDKYKSKKNNRATLTSLKSQESKILLNSMSLCKDLVNDVPNFVTPKYLADFCKALAKQDPKLKVSVKDQKQCSKLGLSAFLAVAQGSDLEPYLIELEYKGNTSSNDFVALVGKGLTYDTGGLCLKPNSYMYGMKNDMAGAACVIATIKAASALKLKTNLKVFVLACENGFGSNSYRPGDILKAFNGKTIEIVDTDAEGRITLADALSYASRDKNVKTIIDFATLTGSTAVTFGDVACGAFSNNSKLLDLYSKAADESGEPIWPLPMNEELKDDLKSSVADLAQCAGRPDASLAAIFLQEFIQNKQDWLHLDIAGTAFLDKATDYFPAGATARGVWRTIKFLKNYKLK